jgi:hypothetical protein
MLRSHNLALAAFGLILASSTSSFAQVRGPACVPAVANPSAYQNCHLRVVRGEEVCRCEIRPQALRRGGIVGDNLESDRNERSRGVGVVGTGAAGNVGSSGSSVVGGGSFPGGGNTGGMFPGGSTGAGPIVGGTTGGTVVGGGTGMGGNNPPANNPGMGGNNPPANNPGNPDKPDTPKGNNGVGNGVDPQPPGSPPVNDGPGTGPGNPGNGGGKSGNNEGRGGKD